MDLDTSYTLRDGFAALWDINILDTLPESKQSGNILYSDSLLLEYIGVFATAFIIFGSIYFAWRLFFEKI